MPMKKNIDIDEDLYDSYIYVNGYRVYKLTDHEVFVEIYLDRPSINPAEFWEHYAYSGEADKWFPQLDPETIQFSVSSGQYGIGSDINAYGRLSNASEVVVQKINDHMKIKKRIKKKVKTLQKQVDSMEDEIDSLTRSVRQAVIRL